MSQQKVLVLVGDAAEELDAMYPIYRLRAAGYVADVAALTRRDVQLVIHDFDPNSDAYTEKNGRKLPVDVTFAEVDPADYTALVIPGGRAPEYLRLNPQVLEMVRYFAGANKPIGAICHAAQILAAAGVIKGRRINAYPACSPEVTLAGGEFVSLEFTDAVTDGNFVTGPAWTAHVAWLRQFLALLG